APIVASDTAPVREVMRDGVHGRLVNFLDVEAVADAAVSMLRNEGSRSIWRRQAMTKAQAYGQPAGLRGYDVLMGTPSQPVRETPARNDRLMQEVIR
ncbi:MAG: hypothetical protein K2X42_06855, partial [Burkholderiaceae bacterium]|nr:hypothetical protein [Burkholderiaceae bacterium]